MVFKGHVCSLWLQLTNDPSSILLIFSCTAGERHPQGTLLFQPPFLPSLFPPPLPHTSFPSSPPAWKNSKLKRTVSTPRTTFPKALCTIGHFMSKDKCHHAQTAFHEVETEQPWNKALGKNVLYECEHELWNVPWKDILPHHTQPIPSACLGPFSTQR